MACQKITYPDKKAAITARNKRQAEDRGLELRVYPCPRCRGWHLAKREVNHWKPTRAAQHARHESHRHERRNERHRMRAALRKGGGDE